MTPNTSYTDALGFPVEPGGDDSRLEAVFGSAWTSPEGGPDRDEAWGGLIPHDAPKETRRTSAYEIRLHYTCSEIAFEEGHPTGPNKTRGRAAILPWGYDGPDPIAVAVDFAERYRPFPCPKCGEPVPRVLIGVAVPFCSRCGWKPKLEELEDVA